MPIERIVLQEDVRFNPVRHAQGLSVFVCITPVHNIDAPVVRIADSFLKGRRIDLVFGRFIPLLRTDDESGAVLSIGLRPDDRHVDIRSQSADEAFRSGGAAFGDEEIDFRGSEQGI